MFYCNCRMETPQTLLKTIPQLSLFGVSIAKEFSVLYRQDATKTLTRKPTESSETSKSCSSNKRSEICRDEEENKSFLLDFKFEF